MEGSGRVISDHLGRPVRMLGVCFDITERKQAQEALQHHQTGVVTHRQTEDALRQSEARVRQRTRELEEKNQALLEQESTVRELSGQLLRAQDEERRRIARELHDSAGQIVAALHMNLLPLETAQNLNSKVASGIKQSIEF